MPVKVQEQTMDLRLDILQNDVWVLNGNEVMGCDHIETWWSSETSVHGTDVSDYPASITTAPEYTVTVCAETGAFTTDDVFIENMPDSNDEYLHNFQDFRIPYLNTINASGVLLTGNLTLTNTNHQFLDLEEFTFLDVNSSNVFVGGFGMAGNRMSQTGVLDGLVEKGVISNNGYSLYFGTFSDTDLPFAQVIPGAVNKKYYTGDFYSFDLLNNQGTRYLASEGLELINELAHNMVVPSAELTDIILENSSNGETLSLKSNFDNLPVIFDTRTIFNLLPLDVIVNLAMQTNAFYSDQVNRWIVECDTIKDTHAMIRFKFHDLKIDVPIEDLLLNATTGGRQLTFSNGQGACFLKVLPTSDSYATLGLSFLKSTFLAIDNNGGRIGMANANKQLQIKQSDYLPFDVNTTQYDQDEDEFNVTKVTSIEDISSGKIPFATPLNLSSEAELTFSPYKSEIDTLTVPARFSGAFITSGEVYLTYSFNGGQPSNALPNVATAADEGGNDDGGDGDSSDGIKVGAGYWMATAIALGLVLML